MEALATIRELIEPFLAEPAEITEATAFEDLGLDSLDIVELSVKIEDHFKIDIDEDDLAEVKTVGDAAALVAKKLTTSV